MKTKDMCLIWIGLAALSGSPDNHVLDGCIGVYSTFLSVADGLPQFRANLVSAASELDLQLDELCWAEPLVDRLAKYEIDDYLLKLAIETAGDMKPRFGEFHGWEGYD